MDVDPQRIPDAVPAEDRAADLPESPRWANRGDDPGRSPGPGCSAARLTLPLRTRVSVYPSLVSQTTPAWPDQRGDLGPGEGRLRRPDHVDWSGALWSGPTGLRHSQTPTCCRPCTGCTGLLLHIALLRALGIPARQVDASGLRPERMGSSALLHEWVEGLGDWMQLDQPHSQPVYAPLTLGEKAARNHATQAAESPPRAEIPARLPFGVRKPSFCFLGALPGGPRVEPSTLRDGGVG